MQLSTDGIGQINKMHKKIVWLLLLLCTCFQLHAQEDTFIDGLIVDAETGETLPLVQV